MEENQKIEENLSIIDEKENNPIENSELEPVFLEMAKAGVMYGHRKPRRDPHFEPYLFAIRNGIEIIDLESTLKHVKDIAKVLKDYKKESKSVLIVGIQPSSRESVMNLASVMESPYVVNKWIGGLITNFGAIRKRISYYLDMKKDEKDNKFQNYTKKEKLMIHREIDKMSERFEGLENYSKTPDAIFVIDSSIKGHKTAMHEATCKGIKKIGIIDNDDNPDEFDYFIPANDHSKSSIDWVINKIISEIE